MTVSCIVEYVGLDCRQLTHRGTPQDFSMPALLLSCSCDRWPGPACPEALASVSLHAHCLSHPALQLGLQHTAAADTIRWASGLGHRFPHQHNPPVCTACSAGFRHQGGVIHATFRQLVRSSDGDFRHLPRNRPASATKYKEPQSTENTRYNVIHETRKITS